MEIRGKLLKMRSELKVPVKYWLRLGDHEIMLNEYIGSEICLDYAGEIHCILCDRKTSKSFFQGMCYPCFQNAPQAEECVLRPELCRAHEGVARDMEYASQNCLQPHFVYLSYTGSIKVGVTRMSQIPTRWIDQGATRAVRIASTPNRYIAGSIEVMLKKNVADKTNWRKMLSGIDEEFDIKGFKSEIIKKFEPDYTKYILESEEVVNIEYPVRQYPEKIKSVGFDKTLNIRGTLQGIKGQYLILSDNRVLNIRKHGGYMVTLKL